MAPTCSQLGGHTVRYYWNDMGGNPDGQDYNDAEFNFSCGAMPAASAPMARRTWC